MGGGGFGVWNACAHQTDKTVSGANPCTTGMFEKIEADPQFHSGTPSWGNRCGGQTYRANCQLLPAWPVDLTVQPQLQVGIPIPPGSSVGIEPDLVELCERSYDLRVRVDGGNMMITSGDRVRCPGELVGITNLQRDDDTSIETMSPGRLSSMMDCCAPASAYVGSTITNHLIPGKDKITPCVSDGYTRV